MEKEYPCQKHDAEIKTLFRTTEGLNKRIDDMGSQRDALTRLTTLMEIQMEQGQKQQIVNEQQTKALVEINANLSSMNENMDKLNTRVEKLEQNESDKKISPSHWFKQVVIYGGGASVVTYIIMSLIKG